MPCWKHQMEGMLEESLENCEHVVIRVVCPESTPSEWAAVLARGETLQVGRSSQNDITIVHPAVSRKHLTLTWDDQGLRVSDLKSKNGTRLNHEYINAACKLKIGDCLELSKVKLFVLSPQHKDAADLEYSEPMIQETARIEASDHIQEKLMVNGEDTHRAGEQTRAYSRSSGSIGQKIAFIVAGCLMGLICFYLSIL